MIEDELTELDLVREGQELTGQVNGRFHVRDRASAIWAGRKLRAAQARIDAAKDDYTREMELLNEWFQAATSRDLETIERWTPELQEWALAERRKAEAEGRKAPATIPLVGLSVRTRRTGEAIQIADSDALIGELRALGETGLIRTTESVLVSDLRGRAVITPRFITPDGEIVTHTVSPEDPEIPEGWEPAAPVVTIDGVTLAGARVEPESITATVVIPKGETE